MAQCLRNGSYTQKQMEGPSLQHTSHGLAAHQWVVAHSLGKVALESQNSHHLLPAPFSLEMIGIELGIFYLESNDPSRKCAKKPRAQAH